jgi:Ca2+/Na+ antiporter
MEPEFYFQNSILLAHYSGGFPQMGSLWELVGRFVFNLAVMTVLVRYIYYKQKPNREFAFTFFLFNTLIFFICYALRMAELSMGLAFGLFAVFGFLRYRTTTIPIKDMTYLLAVIALGLINSLIDSPQVWLELGVINIGILSITYIMEQYWFDKTELVRQVVWDEPEWLAKGNETRFLHRLSERTGWTVTRYEVDGINFASGKVDLTVYIKSHDEQKPLHEPFVLNAINNGAHTTATAVHSITKEKGFAAAEKSTYTTW